VHCHTLDGVNTVLLNPPKRSHCVVDMKIFISHALFLQGLRTLGEVHLRGSYDLNSWSSIVLRLAFQYLELCVFSLFCRCAASSMVVLIVSCEWLTLSLVP